MDVAHKVDIFAFESERMIRDSLHLQHVVDFVVRVWHIMTLC